MNLRIVFTLPGSAQDGQPRHPEVALKLREIADLVERWDGYDLYRNVWSDTEPFAVGTWRLIEDEALVLRGS